MSSTATVPDATGHFGPYGGRYVPETLMHPLQELEAEYFRAQQDPEFQRELHYYLRNFADAPRRFILPNGSRANSAARKFISSAKTCSTPARTRSTTPSARSCSPSAWARRASSPKPARASTASPRPPSRDVRDEMRHLHGRGGLRAAGAECLSHENARRGSRAGARRAKRP